QIDSWIGRVHAVEVWEVASQHLVERAVFKHQHENVLDWIGGHRNALSVGTAGIPHNLAGKRTDGKHRHYSLAQEGFVLCGRSPERQVVCSVRRHRRREWDSN